MAERELSSRQRQILALVVEEYVSSGQPVGSKTLVERSGINVSSSTVRYELAELEDLGLLTHPHTSAGRIPTDSGYRFYVDRVLERPDPRPPAPLALDLASVSNEIDLALQRTTEALAQLTHLMALVTAPALETTVVRHVEVLQLQPQVVVVVVITQTGGVTKRLFVFAEPVDARLVGWSADYLNETLGGQRLGARLLRQCFEDTGLTSREQEFLAELRPAFEDLMEGPQNVFVGGAADVLDEFRSEDVRAFRRLVDALEQRASLLDLMRQSLVSRRPFVRVGAEIGDPALERVSVVGHAYGLTNRNLGTVSLIGPTRMDYPTAIAAVRLAATELSRFVEDIYEA